ncbi:MAG TPA: GNAT family N-acetyltransferase [Paenibacillus sp.]|nr:GNAT family N-acetyltransferase [Paenibacillus sp.]
MMNREAALAQFTKEQRIDLKLAGYRRETDGSVVRHVSLTAEDGFVSYSALTEETADEAIRAQLAYFRGVGQRFEWKAYDYDAPSDLLERLRAHGFDIGEPEALMVLEAADGHPLLEGAVPPAVRRIQEPDGIDELVRLEEEVWGASHAELGDRLKADLRERPETTYVYAAYEEGRAVGAAWMYLHEGTSFASLWGGSTLPSHRGKGLYTALLAARAQAASRAGFKLLTVDASPMSRPILERRGFERLAYTYPCLSPMPER